MHALPTDLLQASNISSTFHHLVRIYITMAAFDASDLDAPMSPQSVPSATAESAYPNPWREIKEYFLKHDITGVYHKLEALRHKVGNELLTSLSLKQTFS
ncbi:hypothetical protein KEM55_001457 [Ascosphaera atra]|nr:hypothetical protein KEM55_001457 [Ascosphaera atra]